MLSAGHSLKQHLLVAINGREHVKARHEEHKRSSTSTLPQWTNDKFVYILIISACGVSALHYQCRWDGVPRGGTWISPHDGTLAAFHRRSARIDGPALRAMACVVWAASPPCLHSGSGSPSDHRWRSHVFAITDLQGGMA